MNAAALQSSVGLDKHELHSARQAPPGAACNPFKADDLKKYRQKRPLPPSNPILRSPLVQSERRCLMLAHHALLGSDLVVRVRLKIQSPIGKEFPINPTKHGLAATLLSGASLLAGATDVSPLVAEQWRTRPLVVVAPSAQHRLLTGLQAQLRQARWRDAFKEREMVLFTVIGGEGRRDGQLLSADQTSGLLQAVNLTASSPAAVFLIGKDGGIKLTEQGDHIALASLFALIDTMPMRQR